MEPRKFIKDLVTEEALTKAFEKIKSDPEFAVEGCHYVIVREDLYKMVVDFFRNFILPDEPVCKSVAHLMPWDEEVEGLIMAPVMQNMSLALVSDTSGELVAVRITEISRRQDTFDKNLIKSEGIKKILYLLDYLRGLCNVFDLYKVEELIHFLALGVHREYRKRGIGTKIMKAAVALVKNLELGAVVIKGEGSSNYSKPIYEKLGFDTLAEVIYEEFKENGEVVFKTDPDQKSERVYGKIVS